VFVVVVVYFVIHSVRKLLDTPMYVCNTLTLRRVLKNITSEIIQKTI